MQVTITGRHVVITPGLKTFINEKLAKLEELFPRVKKVKVVLSVEKYRHTAEILFHADHAEFNAEKTTKDMYASVEGCLKAIQHQANKRKDKLRSQKARHRKGVKLSSKAALSEEGPEDLEVPRLPRLPRIVRLRSLPPKPMRDDEAAMMLQDSEENFLVYEDARTGRAHVMFKRHDGSFGLIEA